MNRYSTLPERSLLASILLDALRDLRSHDAAVKRDALQFIERGECIWVCSLLDIPLARVQARAQQIIAAPVEEPTT